MVIAKKRRKTDFKEKEYNYKAEKKTKLEDLKITAVIIYALKQMLFAET